jgi:hypothetical protein
MSMRVLQGASGGDAEVVVCEQIKMHALVRKGQQHAANRRLDPYNERDGARRFEVEQVDAVEQAWEIAESNLNFLAQSPHPFMGLRRWSPEFINPLLGGTDQGEEGITQMIGAYLRNSGATALIYPSAPATIAESNLGTARWPTTGGWNFVDYRTSKPSLLAPIQWLLDHGSKPGWRASPPISGPGEVCGLAGHSGH